MYADFLKLAADVFWQYKEPRAQILPTQVLPVNEENGSY
jgi:hypothetical protein